MGAFEVTAADEGRHPAGSEELWGESWYLDFAASDTSYGGYVRLGLYPNLGRSWLWVHLVGQDRPLVLLRDHTLPCPDGDEMRIDANGVHVALDAPEPLTRYHVEASGTGVRLDDPATAFHGESGPAATVSVDLDWHSRGPAFPYEATTRYEQSAWVTGSVEVDGQSIAVDCPGQRDHSWGVRDWWLFPWNWTAGHLDDGTFFHAARSMITGLDLFQEGYVIPPGGEQERVDGADCEVRLDPEQLPVGATQRIGPLRFTTTPVGHAPVLLVADDGRESRFPRAMGPCRCSSSAG